MVNRMITPTSGTISVDGRDTASMDVAELRRGIGYVIQHAGLFPHRTVVDNVMTVPRLLGVDKREARTRAMELIERVGLDPAMATRYPAQLSGGQQQRVGVARALAADPPVMLMDEPFSAVDPVVREQLQNEFLRLQSELGKTILFVTHDIDEAVKLGDQVAVLRVGGVLAQLAVAREAARRPRRRLRRRLRRPRPGLPRAVLRRGARAVAGRRAHRAARRHGRRRARHRSALGAGGRRRGRARGLGALGSRRPRGDPRPAAPRRHRRLHLGLAPGPARRRPLLAQRQGSGRRRRRPARRHDHRGRGRARHRGPAGRRHGRAGARRRPAGPPPTRRGPTEPDEPTAEPTAEGATAR